MSRTTPAPDRSAGTARWSPSSWVTLSVAIGVVLFCLALYKGIQDSDYFWHLATGQLIATGGGIPQTDPFSFTWGGQVWHPYSWLAEWFMYQLVAAIGETGALIVFAASPAAIVLVLASALHRRGVRTLAMAAPLMLVGWTLLPYVTLRPQVISWVLMAVLVALLMSVTPTRRWPLYAFPPLVALWANLHGLWVVGVAVVGLYTVVSLSRRSIPAGPRPALLLATVAGCVLAAALTPAGPAGILYPIHYLDPSSWALEHIAEWQSPDFHDPTHWALLVTFAALALNRGRGTPAWLALLPLVGVVMSLSSLRNAPLLAIWAAPTLALGLSERLATTRFAASSLADTPHGRRHRLLELATAGVVVVTAFVALFPRDLTQRFDGDFASRFPVAGVDVLRSVKPGARVLAEYNWGGYALSRLYASGGRVFVDGRDGEMYSAALLDDYSSLVGAAEGWEGLLTKYGVDAILLRPTTPLVRGLVQGRGWCEAYRDATQVLLLPECL